MSDARLNLYPLGKLILPPSKPENQRGEVFSTCHSPIGNFIGFEIRLHEPDV